MNDRETIEQVLAMRTWAVVGATNDPWKPSCHVPEYLQAHGYDVIPVNPASREVLGERCWPDLRSLPAPPDVVDLFRRTRPRLGALLELVCPASSRVARPAATSWTRPSWSRGRPPGRAW